MGVVRAENSDYSKNTEKDNKFEVKFIRPRVGLDGDVDGVERKTSPAQEEAVKVRTKICNTCDLYL